MPPRSRSGQTRLIHHSFISLPSVNAPYTRDTHTDRPRRSIRRAVVPLNALVVMSGFPNKKREREGQKERDRESDAASVIVVGRETEGTGVSGRRGGGGGRGKGGAWRVFYWEHCSRLPACLLSLCTQRQYLPRVWNVAIDILLYTTLNPGRSTGGYQLYVWSRW